MDFKTLAKKVAEMGGDVSLNVGMDQTTISGSVLSEYAPQFIKVVADMVMNPRIDTLVRDMISNSEAKGEISLSEPVYEALMELRAWLFRNVYNNPGSRENQKAAGVVTALFEYYLERPEERVASDPDPITETIDFVAGMTDRYALATYRRLFLPRGEIFA